MLAVGIIGSIARCLCFHAELKAGRAHNAAELPEELAELSSDIQALEVTAVAQPAAFSSSDRALRDSVRLVPNKTAAPAEPEAATIVGEEVTPEVFSAIAKNLTAVFGNTVHIRSIKMLRAREPHLDPWVQQGRLVLHSSHNLPSWGRKPGRGAMQG